MYLSEDQLIIWQNLPRTHTAVKAHEDIRNAVLGSRIWPKQPELYLQGSYANDTSTAKDRDVDIICQVHKDSLFTYDIDSLTPGEQDHFREVVEPASILLQQFKGEVTGIFNRTFGSAAVDIGNKAIRIAGTPGVKLNADVVVCNHYRWYRVFNGNVDYGYIEGIRFFDSQGSSITNYPKLHKANGITKHEETNGWFKRAVRVFKNARTHLVENGQLADGTAPSYFIQGFLYNVDASVFGNTHRDNFSNVLSWLVRNHTKWATFYCQNGIDKLFGTSQLQWNFDDAISFLSALLELEH